MRLCCNLFFLMILNMTSLCMAERTTIRLSAPSSHLPPSPPFSWFDQCEQKSTGSTAHYLVRLLHDLGYQTQWVASDADRSAEVHSYHDIYAVMKQQLLDHKADIAIVSQADNPGLITSQQPIMLFKEVLVKRKGVSVTTGLGALGSYRGGLLPITSSLMKKSHDTKHLQYKIIDTAPQLFEQLKAGDIDYVITNRQMAKLYIRMHDMLSMVDIVDVGLFDLPVYVVMAPSEDNQALLNELDKVVISSQGQPVLEQVHRLYMMRWINYSDCLE